jgi:hypothetical protein
MLELLQEVAEVLPKLLSEGRLWQGFSLTQDEPHMERLKCDRDDHSVYLHYIQPCQRKVASYHPHPWPMAAKVLSGRYGLSFGYGEGLEPPPEGIELVIGPGQTYTMTDPNVWHRVWPLREPTCSLMVAGPRWGRKLPPYEKPQLLPPPRIAFLLRLFQSASR